MLQKLLIAFCTIFVLSACGGSSNSSAPESQDPPQNQNGDGDDTDDTGDDNDDTGDDDTAGDDDTTGEEDTTGDDDTGSGDDTTGDDDTGDECTAQEAQGHMFEFESQQEVDAWFVNGGGTNIELDFDQVNSAMVITPIQWVPDEETYKRQARFEMDPAEDLRGASVTVVMDIPQEYFDDQSDDGSLNMQFVVQGAGYADSWVGLSSLNAGSNTVEWDIAADANAESATHFGIQLTDTPNDLTILEPIVVHSVHVVTEEAVVCDDGGVDSGTGDDETSSTLSAPMDSGWRVDGDAVPLDYVDNGVEYSPTAENQQFVYDFSGPVDLSGASFVISYTVDQDFLASGANVQPFAQTMNEAGSPAHWSCWENNGDHTAGEAYTATCDGLTDFVVEEGVSVKVGLQPKGDTVAGTLTIHSLEVTLAE